MEAKVVRLDVRDDIRRGREPFSKIMEAVARLGEAESLLLIAPFEPKPLFAVLEKQGLHHEARTLESGDWEVLFSRKVRSTTPEKGSTNPSCLAVKTINVDARGLEPPQPMVKILEALAALPNGAEIQAWTDRRPMHLYPQLEQRGFSATSEEQADGSFITCIRRC